MNIVENRGFGRTDYEKIVCSSRNSGGLHSAFISSDCRCQELLDGNWQTGLATGVCLGVESLDM
jgi:hypothetical protein